MAHFPHFEPADSPVLRSRYQTRGRALPWIVFGIGTALVLLAVFFAWRYSSLRREYDQRRLYEHYLRAINREEYEQARKLEKESKRLWGKDPEAFREFPPSDFSRYDWVRDKDDD